MSASTRTRRDPSTQANYENFRTQHLRTDFAIDFGQKRLSGEVRLTLQVLQSSDEVVLDTSFLDLHKVSVNESLAK